MKKRILALMLATVMALSLAACGSSDESKEEDKYEKYEVLLSYLEKENYEQAYKELERIEERNTAAKENAEAEAKDEKDKQDEDDEDPSVIDFAKVERDEEGYVKLTEAQFKGLFEVVEITTENWSEYFEDYEYTEHNEDVNSFGEVEREWDTVHHVFGLKQGIYANLKDIAFKFAGRKVVSDYVAWDSETGNEIPGYRVFLPNEEKYKTYDMEGNFIREDDVVPGWYEKVQESYVADLSSNRSLENSYYTEYECLAATGSLLVFHMPEEFKDDTGIKAYKVIDGVMGEWYEYNVTFINYESQWGGSYDYDYLLEYLNKTEE